MSIYAASNNALAMSFTHLAPTNAGFLQAFCTVEKDGSNLVNSATVAKVVARAPTATRVTNVLSSDAATLTIFGKGFDATASSKNVAALVAKKGSAVKMTLLVSTVSALTYSFTHLAPTNGGALQAPALEERDSGNRTVGEDVGRSVQAGLMKPRATS